MVWPDVRQAVLPPTQTKPPLTKQEDGSGALDRANQVEEETEEVEDDKCVPPDGQGCFSFRQSLLLRAKDTYMQLVPLATSMRSSPDGSSQD